MGIYLAKSTNFDAHNNNISTCDEGISVINSTEFHIYNNTITNATLDSDFYDAGIHLQNVTKNGVVENNTLSNIGNVGILITVNCTNITLNNNTVDVYNITLKNQTFSQDMNEPPMGICVSELYKGWDGTSTESRTADTYANKISKNKNHNITIANNSLDPNVQVLLKVEGNDGDITNDLGNYWHVKFRGPAYLYDIDDLYLNPNFTSITNLYNKTQSMAQNTSNGYTQWFGQ